MKFALDPGDVIGHGCWETIKRLLAPVSSIWIGSFCALVAMLLAEVVDMAWNGYWGEIDELFINMAWALLYAPLALFFSGWSLLVVPLLAYVFYQMIRSEQDMSWIWLGTTGVSGFMVMTSGAMEEMNIDYVAFAWGFYVLLMVSLGVGIVFLKGWQQNAQARHLQEVMAENEMRRMEIEQEYGTKSFGQGNLQSVQMEDDEPS